MPKQFYFKQFSLALVQFFVYTQLNIKQYNFKQFQFSISTQFSSIWPIDLVLPLWARVDLVVMPIKGYSAFPKAPALQESHHQIVEYHIQDTC